MSTSSLRDRAWGGPGADRGAADAALLVGRVGDELAGLARIADDLQRDLGEAIAAAAAHDPAVMLQAQKLDLVAQSLHALSTFLALVARRRVGREPLDLDGAAALLTLTDLGDRLAGRAPVEAMDDFELF